MTTKRVSNEQILNALNELPAAIAAAMAQTTVAQAPVTPEPLAPQTTGDATASIDAQYLNHMKSKVADYANLKGEDAILYARKNARGETKLAYCVASKWTSLRDRGLIGAVAHIKAS